MLAFDQGNYWRERHSEFRGDPRSVGNMGHSSEQAEEDEREFLRKVATVAKAIKPGSSILDLGCGYGRASSIFMQAGCDYVGVDISPDAIADARQRNPAAKFEISDLLEWTAPGQFDVVCFFYVLVHFVDDADWRRMIERSLEWVAPGGTWLIADEFPTERRLPATHVVQRPLAEYSPVLKDRGFRFVRKIESRFYLAERSDLSEDAVQEITFSSPQERQAYKENLPRTHLKMLHTEECRVLPNRRQLLEKLPHGGVVAEVGVAGGDFSAEILARNKPAKLHLIDAWSSKRCAAQLDKVKSRFQSELKTGRVAITQGLSTDVLPTFPDHYFDWVYIDTDHSFETTLAELTLCHTKVKQDGRIAGHNFSAGNVVTPMPYGVIEACLKYCVDFGWRFEFLTVEFSGNPSFALMRI